MSRGRPPLEVESWGAIRKFDHHGTPAASVRYRDSDGVLRRIVRTGRTRAEATRRVTEAIRERLTPVSEDITRESTIKTLAESWLGEVRREGKAPSTISRYESTVRSHVLRVGELRLREFTPARMQRLINAVVDDAGPAAARLAIVALKGMCDVAVRSDAMETNPVPSLKKPPRAKAVVKAPTLEQIHRLQELLRLPDQRTTSRGTVVRDLGDIGSILVATGARIGEVLALRWKDIDFDGGWVTIDATVVRIDGAGLVIQEFPKTDSSTRQLRLPRFAMDVLARRRVDAYCELVFPSATGTPRWPENVRTAWANALRGTELAGMTTRSCRKAVATFLNAAVDLESAREQLGHSSTAVTRSFYVQKSIERPDRSELLEQLGAEATQ